jgi:hypothetical protein
MYACDYFGYGNIQEATRQLSAMAPIGYRGIINADADGNRRLTLTLLMI